ncbi:MAG: ABC transporter permease [Candidatus Azotimanducaceae bacterium]
MARKLAFSFPARRGGSLAGLLSIIGVAVAIAALFTVLSIVNGFDKEFRERLLAAIPHGVIYSDDPDFDLAKMRDYLLSDSNIEAAAPFIESRGMIVSSGTLASVSVRGIDPDIEGTVSILPEAIVVGDLKSLESSSFNVVLGRDLANTLRLSIGDQITLVLPQVSVSLAGSHLTTRRLEVVGFFELDLDIDSNLLIMHANDLRRLKRQKEIDGVSIKTKNVFQASRTVFDVIYSKDSLNGYSWQQSHGALYEAIGTQKATLAFLMMFLVLAAIFNISSNLALTVSQAKPEIAVLKTLGASQRDILIIFLLSGLYIGLLGVLAGFALGFGVTTVLAPLFNFLNDSLQSGFMDEYFIKHFPTKIIFSDVAAIFLTALATIIIFSVMPARKAARMMPARVLNLET